MLSILKNTEKVCRLFDGWQETMLYSCLDGTMGNVFVTDSDNPLGACAAVGCFRFYGGAICDGLLTDIPVGFHILVPQNEKWERAIEQMYPKAVGVTRYATHKDTVFDEQKLLSCFPLPNGYTLAPIDGNLYDECLRNDFSRDFVSSFESKECFLRLGRGFVVLKDGKIVSGASSYTRYKDGIEIEIDTAEHERRKGLAAAACVALIRQCLKERLYPSWDAQNTVSLHLAEKLGYRFSHEYKAYELTVE